MAVDEHDCLIWIWTVMVDSWCFNIADKLLPTGKKLLVISKDISPMSSLIWMLWVKCWPGFS